MNAFPLGRMELTVLVAGMAVSLTKQKQKKQSSTTKQDGLKQKQNLGGTTNCQQQTRIRKALEDQFRNGKVCEGDQIFMLACLKYGLIGMDGFKFCSVEVAKANRKLMLERMK